jgi:uncharacterized membrane protein YoaK (UPF0700 family)
MITLRENDMASIAAHEVADSAGHQSTTPERVRDLFLMGLAVSSGAVDAVAWLGLGSVFTAFQTGNVVFLGIDIAGAAGPSPARVVVSLTAFAAGVLLAVAIVKATRGSGLWPRRVSIALGVSALAQAAFLGGWMATSGQPSTVAGDLLTGLSAFAMGVQSAAVMSLGVTGVFTTAATATLIYLMSDVADWSPSTIEKERLIGVLVSLFAGVAAGAWLFMHARVYVPVLPLIVTVVVIVGAPIALKPAR